MKKIFFLLVLFNLGAAVAFSQGCNCFINIDSADVANGIYQIVPMTLGTDTGSPPDYHCNNCSSPPMALPFNFCFYGRNYDTVYINNKGNLSFVNPVFNYSSKGFPAGIDTQMIAAFWSNIDDVPSLFSDIYYQITPTHLIVQWNVAGYNTFDDDLYNNFQITITNGSDTILPPGNNVSFCYLLMQWASADSSGGSMGFGGAPAVIGVNKGDGIHYAQFGTFDFPGYTYYGPSDTNNELYWLNGRMLTFNTCVSGNEIPPVIVNPDSCSQYTLCAGDTLLLDAYFICPQSGQAATLTVSAPGLSGIIDSTSFADSIYQISTQLVAALSDTGTHIISLIATDNNSPPLKDSMVYTVTILNCDSASGIHQLTHTNSSLTLFPNPNNGKFTLQMVNGKLSMLNEKIQIYNILGEQVYSQYTIHNSTFNIDLSSRPSGVYFYRVISDTGNLIGDGKFVIQ